MLKRLVSSLKRSQAFVLRLVPPVALELDIRFYRRFQSFVSVDLIG